MKTSRRTWGPRHPLVAAQLNSLAMLHMAEGKAKPAVARMREALDIEEPNLALVLATGTESDHATYFGQIAYQLHMAITLHTRYAVRDRDAARLALTTVLRRKGRILDAAAASVAALRGKLSADDQKLLDELAASRAQLAALIVAGPKATDSPEQYAVEVGRLEREVKRLEDQVRRRSTAYRVQSQPIELAPVQKAIPSDGVLVEIVIYQPYDARAVGPWDPKKQPPRRYGAYLLRSTGDPELGRSRATRRRSTRRRMRSWPPWPTRTAATWSRWGARCSIARSRVWWRSWARRAGCWSRRTGCSTWSRSARWWTAADATWCAASASRT